MSVFKRSKEQSNVFIVGASGGIGCGTAEEFAKAGAKLGLTGRNEENLKKTAKLCEEQGLKPDNVCTSLKIIFSHNVVDT